MKDVFVNGRFLCRKPTGVDRYAMEVLRGIDQLISDEHPSVAGQKWSVLLPTHIECPAEIKNINFKTVGPFTGTIWEQLTLPFTARGNLLINLCNAAPILKKQQLVVIHDATTERIPAAFSKNFVRWYKIMIPLILKHSKTIATVSAFSKSEILISYGIDREIAVVKEGADHFDKVNSDDSILSKHALKGQRYILAVGSMAPHKNFKTIIDAIHRIPSPDFACVIAGGTDPRVFSTSPEVFPQWVKHVGYVTDQQLKSLYQHADCFIFPSIYEGYGLPPTEALALGCPVISSNTASMPEICGNHAKYFSPNNPTELAQLISEHMMISSKDLKRNPTHIVSKWRDAAIDIANLTH